MFKEGNARQLAQEPKAEDVLLLSRRERIRLLEREGAARVPETEEAKRNAPRSRRAPPVPIPRLKRDKLTKVPCFRVVFVLEKRSPPWAFSKTPL